MTIEEFETLRNRVKASGETLKSALKAEGVAYSTYNYWLRKTGAEQKSHPIAPITIREPRIGVPENMLSGLGMPGFNVLRFTNHSFSTSSYSLSGIISQLTTPIHPRFSNGSSDELGPSFHNQVQYLSISDNSFDRYIRDFQRNNYI